MNISPSSGVKAFIGQDGLNISLRQIAVNFVSFIYNNHTHETRMCLVDIFVPRNFLKALHF